MKSLHAIFSSLFLLIPLEAWAANGESMGSMMLKMLWALGIVVGLILILYGIARKRFGIAPTGNNKNIKILELRPMMNRSSLALVEVHGQKMLLGLSSTQIQFLTKIDSDPSQRSFQEILETEQ